MDYQGIKESLLNQFIESASEDQLRYLDSYFDNRVFVYCRLREKIRVRLCGMVEDDINRRGGV